MVQIQIIPNNYPNANELAGTIERVIKQHPLKDAVTSTVRQQLFDMPIFVEKSDFLVDVCLGVRLRFDPMMYQDELEREKVLYHEFTHIMDRLNPKFGIDCESENEALTIQPKEMTEAKFRLYMHIWDCYTDGRLAQFGQNPHSLQERLDELHSAAKHDGSFASEVDKILENAWNSKNLTFNNIISLVQKCLQYWQPKETEETF